MAKDTKRRILEAALEIFARDGYEGTNIKDIAESVGIVKSALYKHFDSKEAIWSAVMEQIAEYYETQVSAEGVNQVIPYTAAQLKEYTMKTVEFTVNDNRIIQVRKVLTAEQFRDDKSRDFANKYFLYRNESVFKNIFAVMMEKGTIKKCDPKTLAFAYTAPITALVHLCDRDPSKKEEAMTKMNAFIDMFIEEYSVKAD